MFVEPTFTVILKILDQFVRELVREHVLVREREHNMNKNCVIFLEQKQNENKKYLEHREREQNKNVKYACYFIPGLRHVFKNLVKSFI